MRINWAELRRQNEPVKPFAAPPLGSSLICDHDEQGTNAAGMWLICLGNWKVITAKSLK